jgi:hypothetical protein
LAYDVLKKENGGERDCEKEDIVGTETVVCQGAGAQAEHSGGRQGI